MLLTFLGRLLRPRPAPSPAPGEAALLAEVADLAEVLIPGPRREVPRRLLVLLALAAVRGEPTLAHDPYGLLRRVRALAWAGYADAPALARHLRAVAPRGPEGRRLGAYVGEIAAADSTYLFLPAVAGIDRHQALRPGPRALRLDGVLGAFGGSGVARALRRAFALAPRAARERDAIALALLTLGWGRGLDVPAGALPALAAPQLRRLHARCPDALAGVAADASRHPAAADLLAMAEEVSAACPWVWLDALFVAENWRVGPRRFARGLAVEVGDPARR